jgi:hypothetical protein
MYTTLRQGVCGIGFVLPLFLIALAIIVILYKV